MSSCLGFVGWLFGHKYEAVYDTTSRPGENMTVRFVARELIELLRVKTSTYRLHACKRCGDVVEAKK